MSINEEKLLEILEEKIGNVCGTTEITPDILRYLEMDKDEVDDIKTKKYINLIIQVDVFYHVLNLYGESSLDAKSLINTLKNNCDVPVISQDTLKKIADKLQISEKEVFEAALFQNNSESS